MNKTDWLVVVVILMLTWIIVVDLKSQNEIVFVADYMRGLDSCVNPTP